jgi:hypothetical protein
VYGFSALGASFLTLNSSISYLIPHYVG